MKYILIFLYLFLCVDDCGAQQISLKLLDTLGEKINLTADFLHFQDDILLNANDNFRTLKTKNPTAVFCNDVNRRTFIFAEPNDTIEIRLSSKGLIEYKCKNNKFRKLESEFINQCFEKYSSTENSHTKNILNSFDSANLSKYNDPKYIKEKEMLSQFYKNKLVSKAFYDYFMDVYWCLALDNELEESPISEEFAATMESSYDKADHYLNFSQYRYLLYKYTQKSIETSGIKADLSNNLKYIIANYSNEKIKDYLLYQEMVFFLSEHHERNSVDENTIKLFRENCKNKIFIDEVNKDLEPAIAPVFLENIIKKHKGRLVLVDFWASWCMPCRQEFPYERILIKKYPDISFVFISIDKSNANWQKVSKEYSDMLNEDNSYLLLKSVKDEILQKIDISTIPRYVLFDKDGKIIDVDAPRPSSNEIEKLLQQYL